MDGESKCNHLRRLKAAICSMGMALSLVLGMVDPSSAQGPRRMSDESLELGKKWLLLAEASRNARNAVDDLLSALRRMEYDHSEGAWNAQEARWRQAVSLTSNLGGVACDFVWFEKICKPARDIAKIVNDAWHCREGSDSYCARMGMDAAKAWAGQISKYYRRTLDAAPLLATPHISETDKSALEKLKAACKASGAKGCDAINALNDAKEIYEMVEFERNLNLMNANNVRIGVSAISRVQAKAIELERQASEAYAAFRTQREKDQLAQAENNKKQSEGTKAEYQQPRTAAPTQVPLQDDLANQAQQESHRDENNSVPKRINSRSVNQEGETDRRQGGEHQAVFGKEFDVTVWNYGDPVPGVERPAEFDKPKRKSFCHLKDTSCLNPFDGGVEEPGGKEKAEQRSRKRGGLSSETIRQDIDDAVRGGLLSSEKIRQHIDQVVRRGWHDPDKGEGWHDLDKGEGYGLSPDEQLLASNSPSNHAGVLPNQSLPPQLPLQKDRAQSERYRDRCAGIFNNLQASIQAATNLSMEVADSQGVGNVSAQIKGVMSQLPTGHDGGEIVKQMIVMAGGEDRAIALTRQSISEWRRYLTDLQRHTAKDYAISQQKYQTLITLGNESVRVSEMTVEALDCYRMSK